MASTSAKQHRHEQLMEIVFEQGVVRVEDLQRDLGVSNMTLYRDLAELESRQVISRNRGEVSATASSLSETSFSYRMANETAAKTLLAPLAADLVKRGDSVMVDDSTTAHFVLTELVSRGPLTLVTNGLGAIELAHENPDLDVIMLGGRYSRALHAYYGPATTAGLGHLQPDVVVMGAAAIQDGMVLHPYEEVAEFKHLALRQSKFKILVVTASKFSRTALYRVAPLTDFDVIVTDLPTPQADLAAARETGVEILTPSVANV